MNPKIFTILISCGLSMLACSSTVSPSAIQEREDSSSSLGKLITRDPATFRTFAVAIAVPVGVVSSMDWTLLSIAGACQAQEGEKGDGDV